MVPGAFFAAARFQLWHSRRKPGDIQALVTAPLYTLVFMSIVGDAGRHDLVGHAVLAPALMAVIMTSLLVAGEIIDEDRFLGTLEATIAAPTPLPVVVAGRVLGVTLVGLLGFVGSWLVAWLAFGELVPIANPVVFAVTLLAVAAGMSGTALFMAALFVLARSARTFQNALSYPIFALGGVMVPVALLPWWAEPLSRLLYVSWAADLLRDSLAPGPVAAVWPRLAMVLVLAALAGAAGRVMIARIMDRVRQTGAISHA